MSDREAMSYALHKIVGALDKLDCAPFSARTKLQAAEKVLADCLNATSGAAVPLPDERAIAAVVLAAQADMSASLEAGIKGQQGVYPDWVYSARDAIQHRDANVPWLPDLLDALGWQGGTVHEALQAVKRLVAADHENERAARKEWQHEDES